MKTKHLLLSILLPLFVIISSQAFAENELIRISPAKNADSLQLHFSFTRPPKFNTNIDKRRIDIQFADTKPSSDFQQITAGDDIVKILSRELDGQLVISVFFRYQPQDFQIEPSIRNTIVLNVTLGNEYSSSYEKLATRLKGVSTVNRDSIDFTNPYIRSPYARDWLSFFTEFEPRVDIEVPVSFTTPPFPIIALLPPGLEKNRELLNEEMRTLADEGLWTQLADAVVKKIAVTREIDEQKLLALVYGEALARAGNFKPAYQQLYLLQQEYGEEKIAVYARYWLNLLRALHEDPLLASYEFDRLADMIPDNSPLAPYYLLSRIETTLAARDYRKLNTLLQKDEIALPPEIENRIIIRQADYWRAVEEPVRAYAAYNLLAQSTLIRTQPHSYNNFCATSYAQRRFQDAATCFQNLADLLAKEATRGLVNYKEQMARLQFTPPEKLISRFSQIEAAYPQTTAYCLARMKENDLLLLKDLDSADKRIGSYQAIAGQCSQRNIRETALFKEILLQKETGNISKAIDMALDFVREFQSGDVRISAQALLIELVPLEIKRLVERKEYVNALVLARKNRELFERKWINSKFLIDIAEAYQQLGLFDEAQKLYLYLIEIVPVAKKERFYPVIIEAALNSGNYALLDDYASQYIYNYPEGKFYNDIVFLQLQSLITRNRITDALEILPDPVPDEPRFYQVEADIMFQLDNYAECLRSLYNLEQHQGLNQTEQFMMAESLFTTGNYESALLTYQGLPEEHPYHDQILYRRAEIARIKGKEQQALSLLQQIVKKGKSGFWKNLAERELQYDKIKDAF